MTKFFGTSAAALAALALSAGAASLPTAASAQVIGCDAPGGRQAAGAVIGGVLGGALGNRVAGRGDRTTGTIVGAGAGAAAGSYIGCRQQQNRARNTGYGQQAGGGEYRATTNVRVRSGPGAGYSQVGSLRAGDRFDVARNSGGWVQLNDGGWIASRYVAAN